MRFYDLKITSPSGQSETWTSFPSGTYDPGALDIYFDAFVVGFYPTAGASTVGVEGVDLKYLEQPQQFNGWDFTLSAGMRGGLPLSAAQPTPGTILRGQVYGTFGNWIGDRISLDFVVIAPLGYSDTNPGNFVFSWPAGTQLSDAIQKTLKTAYPDISVQMEIGKYVSPHTEVGYWGTPRALSRTVNRLTVQALGATSPGVSIYWLPTGKLLVTDNSTTQQQSPKKIKYTDLIGQPTWIEPGVISVPVILRADIQVNDLVQLPEYKAGGKNVSGLPGTAQTIPNVENATYNYPLTFRGNFIVRGARHLGQFRGASGEEWMTVLECAALAPVTNNG